MKTRASTPPFNAPGNFSKRCRCRRACPTTVSAPTPFRRWWRNWNGTAWSRWASIRISTWRTHDRFSNSLPEPVRSQKIALHQRPRHYPALHFHCAGLEQRFGQCIQRAAAGHHVVDDGHAFALQAGVAGKRTAQVFAARLERQAGLRGGIDDARSGMRQHRQVQIPGDVLGDFMRLVEAAFPEPVGMQRHGDEGVGQGMAGGVRCQRVRQQGDDGEVVAVFERLYQTIQRESISVGGARAAEMRRMFEAVAANCAIQGGQRAHRTTRLRMVGQVSGTVRTELGPTAECAAEQAILRQQGVHKFCADVQYWLGQN